MDDFAGTALEAHIRVCFVDHLLKALNWDLPGADRLRPTLWTEVPIRAEDDVVLFLDYFGVERDSASALIVVETKRPDARLPRADGGGHDANSQTARQVARRRAGGQIASAIVRGLRSGAGSANSGLTKEWHGWLEKMCTYVATIANRSLRAPKRAVFTNGEWLIVFTEPSATFAGDAKPDDVVVFLDRDDIDERAQELFVLLAFENVSEEIRPLAPEEVVLLVEPSSINGYMHGLWLLHAEQATIFANETPRMTVSPILLLRSSRGYWLEVLLRRERELPVAEEDLEEHLRLVAEDSRELLDETRRTTGMMSPVVSLREHFAIEDQVRVLPGVVEVRERDHGKSVRVYRVLTGTQTHLIRIDPAARACKYHDWSACNKEGRAHLPLPEAVPTIKPRRNFFVDGRLHHCAHNGVNVIKGASLGPANKRQTGVRSGSAGDPFCEVLAFDHTLCCRTCAFEEACASAPAFNLPCNEAIARRRLPVL